MKHKQKCPRCKATQSFGTKKKETVDKKVELYIQCTICRWKATLLVDSADNISIIRDIDKLKVRAVKDPSLYKTLEKRTKRLKNE